ncbi:MAG: hypothetical protein QOJ56_5525 [Mycobacterium sp.]|jgi:hypothetical protein|nr:hypothetical protein [Mycobacterium sp.]
MGPPLIALTAVLGWDKTILRPARRLSDMFEQLAPFGGDIR